MTDVQTIADKRARLELDTDPVRISEMLARRKAYQEETAAWGMPMRCKTNVCDGDGSCVYCGADQGEACRPTRQALEGEQ